MRLPPGPVGPHVPGCAPTCRRNGMNLGLYGRRRRVSSGRPREVPCPNDRACGAPSPTGRRLHPVPHVHRDLRAPSSPDLSSTEALDRLDQCVQVNGLRRTAAAPSRCRSPSLLFVTADTTTTGISTRTGSLFRAARSCQGLLCLRPPPFVPGEQVLNEYCSQAPQLPVVGYFMSAAPELPGAMDEIPHRQDRIVPGVLPRLRQQDQYGRCGRELARGPCRPECRSALP